MRTGRRRLPKTWHGEGIGRGILLGVFTRDALAAELELWLRRGGDTRLTVVLERVTLGSSKACRVELGVHSIIRDEGRGVLVRIHQVCVGYSKRDGARLVELAYVAALVGGFFSGWCCFEPFLCKREPQTFGDRKG